MIQKTTKDILQFLGPKIIRIRELLVELNGRNEVLTTAGWFHLGLFFLTATAAQFDERLVLGVNTWIKPMKFMLSITIYVWTVAWFVGYLNGPRWAIGSISWCTSVAMLIESVCLIGQAARGLPSHFNISTDFDGAIYSVMGIMIAISTVMALLLLYLLCSRNTAVRLERVYLWSLRFGILIFILGSADGVIMIQNEGHAVGLPDGGIGLPLVNWSMEGGDLRIAHMLGLHALQLVPLMGFYISRKRRYATFRVQLGYLMLFMVVYLGIFILTLQQALVGNPIIAL